MRANRDAERSATPLGELPEFETYCNFSDFPIVVSRKRIVFLIAPNSQDQSHQYFKSPPPNINMNPRQSERQISARWTSKKYSVFLRKLRPAQVPPAPI